MAATEIHCVAQKSNLLIAESDRCFPCGADDQLVLDLLSV